MKSPRGGIHERYRMAVETSNRGSVRCYTGPMNTKDTGFWVGIGVLAIVAIALLWYMATHPAPAQAPGTGQNAATVGANGTIHDDGQYYAIDATYPTTTTLATTAGTKADEAARAAMESFVNTQIATFKQQNIDTLTPDDIQVMQLGQDGRQYALDIAYTATSSPTIDSYVFTIYQDTMGAHPNGTYQTFNFDAATGDRLTISSIFLPNSGFLNRLSTMARASLPATIASEEQIDPSQVDMGMIADGTGPTIDNFSQFYVANGQLVIIFPPYQVGPYSLGTVLFPIPLSQVKNILEPEYR